MSETQSTETVAPAPAPAAPVGKPAPAAQWFIVHVYSGFEKRVAGAIQEKIATMKMEGLIQEVSVPVEEVVEMRRGRKGNSARSSSRATYW